jgi:hypothetical protein
MCASRLAKCSLFYSQIVILHISFQYVVHPSSPRGPQKHPHSPNRTENMFICQVCGLRDLFPYDTCPWCDAMLRKAKDAHRNIEVWLAGVRPEYGCPNTPNYPMADEQYLARKQGYQKQALRWQERMKTRREEAQRSGDGERPSALKENDGSAATPLLELGANSRKVENDAVGG